MHRSKKNIDEVFKLQRDNALGLEEEKNEKKNIRRFVFLFFIFLIVLYFATFGITVSYYKGGSDKDQEIDVDPIPGTDDQIIFTYSDVIQGESGIALKNAMPMSDERGKLLTGTGNYFDFSVTATSKKANLLYLEKIHFQL